jgi:hypothetical protein
MNADIIEPDVRYAVEHCDGRRGYPGVSQYLLKFDRGRIIAGAGKTMADDRGFEGDDGAIVREGGRNRVGHR